MSRENLAIAAFAALFNLAFFTYLWPSTVKDFLKRLGAKLRPAKKPTNPGAQKT